MESIKTSAVSKIVLRHYEFSLINLYLDDHDPSLDIMELDAPAIESWQKVYEYLNLPENKSKNLVGMKNLNDYFHLYHHKQLTLRNNIVNSTYFYYMYDLLQEYKDLGIIDVTRVSNDTSYLQLEVVDNFRENLITKIKSLNIDVNTLKEFYFNKNISIIPLLEVESDVRLLELIIYVNEDVTKVENTFWDHVVHNILEKSSFTEGLPNEHVDFYYNFIEDHPEFDPNNL